MTNTRQEVYAAIDEERAYQDTLNPNVLVLDAEVTQVTKYERKLVDSFSNQPFNPTEPEARAHLRKIAAICVRALEHHGAPRRKHSPSSAPEVQVHGFGASPPPQLAWQKGKSAGTIDFVREAEQILAAPPISSDEARMLKATIDRLKCGGVSLDETDTVQTWLNRLRTSLP